MGAINVRKILKHNLEPVIGRDDLKTLFLTALLAEGHVLVEDYPGSGMEHLAWIVGNSIVGGDLTDGELVYPFRRFHCTGSLCLEDIVFVEHLDHDGNPGSSAWKQAAPVPPEDEAGQSPAISRLLLSGLLLENFGGASDRLQTMVTSAMSDGVITVNGRMHQLNMVFVIASHDQNSAGSLIGLSPFLLDHFMLKTHVGTIPARKELELLKSSAELQQRQRQTISFEELEDARKEIRENILFPDELLEKLATLVDLIERDERVQKNGRPSTRALLDFKQALQAYAFLQEANQVEWDAHVLPLALPALGHRIRCKPSIIHSPENILRDCFHKVDARSAAVGKTAVPEEESDWTLEDAWEVYQRLEVNINGKIFGRDNDDEGGHAVGTVELLLTALFSGGHLLLEDYPGSGKSYMAKTLGESIEDDLREDEVVEINAYKRIQCTPDLLPSDITGYMMLEDGKMVFRRGPVFAYVLLADEINRTPPKVQSAMLEAMAEKQVTVDDTTYRLGELFFVIATQNPLDRKGTFELPHAQLDRFLFKRMLASLDHDSVKKVLSTKWLQESKEIPRKVPVTSILKSRSAILRGVGTLQANMNQDIRDVLLAIRQAFDRRYDEKKLQDHERWQCLKPAGQPSARCLESFLKALKVRAFVRFFKEQRQGQRPASAAPVIDVEDVRLLTRDLLRHRIVPKYNTEPEDLTDAAVQEYRTLADKIIVKAVQEGIEMFTRGV